MDDAVVGKKKVIDTILDAGRKLDMSKAARMKRAREMGYTTPAYTGSTHDIDAFDASRANPESDMGRGVYASTSIDDVNANYAGVGPDLTSRLELEAERINDRLLEQFSVTGRKEVLESLHRSTGDLRYISARIADMSDDDAADEVAHMLARRQLIGGNEGVVYPLMLKTDKYAVIGGPQSTRLDGPDFFELAREQIDPADYADEIDFEDAVNELAYELHDTSPDSVQYRVWEALRDTDLDQDARDAIISDLSEPLLDGSLDVSDLDAAIRRHVIEAYDEGGDLLSPGAIEAQVLENLGYEGVIDNTVDAKFGTNREFGKAMAGVTPETQHIITFPGYEHNIRSVNAAFDPNKADSSNILAGLAGAGVLGSGLMAPEAEASPTDYLKGLGYGAGSMAHGLAGDFLRLGGYFNALMGAEDPAAVEGNVARMLPKAPSSKDPGVQKAQENMLGGIGSILRAGLDLPITPGGGTLRGAANAYGPYIEALWGKLPPEVRGIIRNW